MTRPHRAAAHFPASRSSRHLGRIAALCALALGLTGISTVGFGYARLQGNVTQHNVEDLLSDRPTIPADSAAGNAQNILLMGSDVRSGASDIDGSGAAGDVEGMRADTTMLLHISADRKRVTVVSIPRDLIVDIPECKVLDESGNLVRTAASKSGTRFNAAFAIGGSHGNVGSAAACTMATVEQMTGIRLTGFMVANFAAFKNIVDAIGGVPMYFPEALHDKYSGLDVSQGCVLVNGTQALALARARKSIGDGSDIGRIGRQQELVTAMLTEAMKLNLFTDVGKLFDVLSTVTSNLETSQGLGNIPTLAGLIGSLRGISLADVQFLTMPFAYAGNVVEQRKGDEVLWNALANDTPVTITVSPSGEIIEKAPETTPATPAQSPAQTDSSAPTAQGSATPTATTTSDAAATPGTTATSTTATCTKENAK